MEPTDDILFNRCTERRDAEAFRAIVSRHAAMVYSTCRRILSDGTLAEDVTQECFAKLAQTRKLLGASLGPWLHAVATNRSRDCLRAEKRRLVRETTYANEDRAAPEVEWRDIEPLVDDAIEKLPESLRHPVVRHFLEGRTHEEISQSLNVSLPGTALSQQLFRAIEAEPNGGNLGTQAMIKVFQRLVAEE